MADVLAVMNESNERDEGGIVCSADKCGNYASIDGEVTNVPSVASFNSTYNDRIANHPLYYFGGES